MQDNDNWPEEAQPKSRSAMSGIVFPLLAFVAGGAAVYGITTANTPRTVVSQPGVATFGGGAPAPAQPASAATTEELQLMYQINAGVIGQLREYNTRLRSLADVAEAEGAPSSAKGMREFALEIQQQLDSYDQKIAN